MATKPALPALSNKPSALVLLAVVLVASAAAVAMLVNLAGEILEAVGDGNGIALWDRPVLDWAVANRTPPLTSALVWFTNSGGPVWQPITMGAVALLLWWRWRDPTPLVLVALAEGGALAIALVTKRVVDRARPPIADAVPPYETSPSFPSGHTIHAVVAAAMLAYLLIRHLWDHPAWQRVLVGVLALVYAGAMGFTRVFLGYHWLTDVLAAVALGLAWVAVVIGCHVVWRAVRHRTERAPIEEEQKRPILPPA